MDIITKGFSFVIKVRLEVFLEVGLICVLVGLILGLGYFERFYCNIDR